MSTSTDTTGPAAALAAASSRARAASSSEVRGGAGAGALATSASSSSRISPPTSQPRSPASASCSACSAERAARAPLRSGAHIAAGNARADRAGHLVVDRLQLLRDLLGADALLTLRTDDHGLGSEQLQAGGIAAEGDRDVVHAHSAHLRRSTPADQHLSAPGEAAPKAVGVADRQHADVCVGLRAVAAAVGRVLPGAQQLDLSDV